MSRTYVLYNFTIKENPFTDFLEKAKLNPVEDRILFFTAFPENIKLDIPDCEVKELLPENCRDSESKARNYIFKWLFDNKVSEFVHIVTDEIKVHGEISKFVNSIEKLMVALDQISWFSTRLDICNYVFEKYNAKFSISVDVPVNKKDYHDTVYFVSNANLFWTIYDFSKATFDMIKFDEDFKIHMYIIIEYLSRRRKYQPALMNCYPTVDEEKVIDKSALFESDSRLHKNFSKADFEKEAALFSLKKVDFAPELNVEKSMELLCKTLGIDPVNYDKVQEVSELEKKEQTNENTI